MHVCMPLFYNTAKKFHPVDISTSLEGSSLHRQKHLPIRNSKSSKRQELKNNGGICEYCVNSQYLV